MIIWSSSLRVAIIIRIFSLLWLSSSNYKTRRRAKPTRFNYCHLRENLNWFCRMEGRDRYCRAQQRFSKRTYHDLIMAHRWAIFHGPFGIKGRFHWCVPISSKCIAICAPPPRRYRSFNRSFKLWKFEYIYIYIPMEVIMKFSPINSWFDFTIV